MAYSYNVDEGKKLISGQGHRLCRVCTSSQCLRGFSQGGFPHILPHPKDVRACTGERTCLHCPSKRERERERVSVCVCVCVCAPCNGRVPCPGLGPTLSPELPG